MSKIEFEEPVQVPSIRLQKTARHPPGNTPAQGSYEGVLTLIYTEEKGSRTMCSMSSQELCLKYFFCQTGLMSLCAMRGSALLHISESHAGPDLSDTAAAAAAADA